MCHWLTFRPSHKDRGYVRDEGFPGRVTTREVLGREWEIVCLAQEGIGSYGPLCALSVQVAIPHLDEEQRQAVEHILTSRDFVTLFRGGAGTGKSYTLREVDRRSSGAARQSKSSPRNASR